MKRLLSGVQMLADLHVDKISNFEKMFYLVFVFLPVGKILDLLIGQGPTPLAGNSLSYGYVFMLVTIVFFTFLNSKIDNKSIVQRFVCLMVPSTVTTYLLLIPMQIVIEKVLLRYIESSQVELVIDYMTVSYQPLFVISSLMIWKRRSQI